MQIIPKREIYYSEAKTKVSTLFMPIFHTESCITSHAMSMLSLADPGFDLGMGRELWQRRGGVLSVKIVKSVDAGSIS